MSKSTPTEDDLDAAAGRTIARLTTILYILEMKETELLLLPRSRQGQQRRIREYYGRWMDTRRIDQLMGWAK